MRIGVTGLAPHGFASITRTAAFYHRALSTAGTVIDLDDRPVPSDIDAIVGFGGDRWWRGDERPACPVLHAMHGGPVLDAATVTRCRHLEVTDVLIGNCTSDLAIFASWFPTASPQVCRLPLPVDRAVFRPRTTALARELLGLDPAALVVGYVGRLIPQKGFHTYLDLLAHACDRLAPRPVRGLVVGTFWNDYPVLPYTTDEYAAYCAARIDRLGLGDALCTHRGDLDDAALGAAYAAMDVLVHPTTTIDENFGYSAVEAMSCGTPVIGAAYGGLKDSVRDGVTGAAIATWATSGGIRLDLGGARDALVDLLRDDARRRALQASAATWAAQHGDEARATSVLVGALRRAVCERRALRAAGGTVPLAVPDARPVAAASAERDLLPPTDPPYAHYRHGIDRYVSQPPPVTTAATRVQLAARTDVACVVVCLDDPAWPARYELGEQDLAIVTELAERGEMIVADLTARGHEPDAIDRLIAEGLVLARVERPAP